MSPSPNQFFLVTINSTGRQAASIVRVASAVGWHVRAQVHEKAGLVAEELGNLPNVRIVEGQLEDAAFISKLFKGADIAFVNTTHWGDEEALGRALADEAKKAGIKHYVYSSMPDHSTCGQGWKALPLWASKYKVEKYIRSLGMPCSFVYTGIYNNNFTSLPFPLFRMDLQPDGSFLWQAPFHPDDKLPWLDAEHDVGPALLQIFKEGPKRWNGHRIPFTFEVLNPVEACEAFSRGVGRPVRYRRGPIQFNVSVPPGYREHLEALQDVLGKQRAPYFGPNIYYPSEAIELWEGNRGIEEYAREVFPVEEAAHGLTWMEDDEDDDTDGVNGPGEKGDDQNSDVDDPEEVRAEAEKNYTGSC